MLITFRSKASSNIMMFGDMALRLLRMMGHSGTTPGSILSGDIPEALVNLRQKLAKLPEEPRSGNDLPENTAISLRLRAFPLIELLTAAAGKGYSVTWDCNQQNDQIQPQVESAPPSI